MPQKAAVRGGDDPAADLGYADDGEARTVHDQLSHLYFEAACVRRLGDAVEDALCHWAALDRSVIPDPEDDQPAVGHRHRGEDLVEPIRPQLEIELLMLEPADLVPEVGFGHAVGKVGQRDGSWHRRKISQSFDRTTR